MLELNIAGVLKSRGVDNVIRFLVEKGMTYQKANRLLKGQADRIDFATLERFCLTFNCTPDDLFVWRKDDSVSVPADHSLNKLKPKEAVVNPVDRIKGLSPKKLEKLKELLDGLEKEG